MAVQINFFSLVIRKFSIKEKCPDGLPVLCQYTSTIEDEHLFCLANMDEEVTLDTIDCLLANTSLTLATKEKPDADMMQCHYGFGFFPYYENHWLEKYENGLNGFMYLAGTEPGEEVIRLDANKKK